MDRLGYLYKFRKCLKLDSVERVYEHMRDSIPDSDVMAFLSAYDHRKAEITCGKIWDKVPAQAWGMVK